MLKLLPAPAAKLADCIWLPRILAKARLSATGQLPEEYAARFGHPGGVDGQFLSFFGLTKADIEGVSGQGDDEVAAWFRGRNGISKNRIKEWNHIAVNLGRPGFPMADRLPIALATSYSHLADRGIASWIVFALCFIPFLGGFFSLAAIVLVIILITKSKVVSGLVILIVGPIACLLSTVIFLLLLAGIASDSDFKRGFEQGWKDSHERRLR